MKPSVTLLLLAAIAAPAQQYRAFWVDAFHPGYKSPAQVDQLVEDLVRAKANAVFPEVRRLGGSYYVKSLEPPVQDSEYAQGFDALQYLLERAHANGIEVHAWFQVTPLWSAAAPPADPRHVWHKHGPNAAGDDMWMSVNPKGQKGPGLDPGHPDALRYLADVITDVASNYGVDGLHLDFIRYWPETDNWGWNPKAVDRFQRLWNATGTPDAADPRWSEFRRQQVTALVRQIYLRMLAIRPAVKLTGALITWSTPPATEADFVKTEAYWRVFQNWRAWLEEGILDFGIPMNYIDNSGRYTKWFDQWTEFEKDNQYRRGIVVGPGVYLNTIPDALSQIGRALAPSPAGNRALGVTLYSYATTNKNIASAPNAEFYKAVGDLFGDQVAPPALPWKTAQDRGHVYGWVHVSEGPAWLADGATVRVESDTGGSESRRVATDGSGFFGAVDLPPDRYRVRVERNGAEIYRTVAQDVQAGVSVPFEMFLKGADFTAAIPKLTGVSRNEAASGDLVALTGSMIGTEFLPATSVPLPLDLGGTQVVVNGIAAPLFSVSANRIELQLPYVAPREWTIFVRRAGLESAILRMRAVPAAPAIIGVRGAGGYLEIYATGLGLVDPPIEAGLGGGIMEPLSRVVLPVIVRVTTASGELALQPLYAGLQPYAPSRYQVNVQLPEGVTSGTVRLELGSAVSNSVVF